MDTSKPADLNDLFSAKGLTIVITGAGSGIGLAFTHALAHNGAEKIFILGRRLDVLERAAKDINPSTVIPVQCDVSSAPSLATALSTIKSQTSHIDVLINNAGITGPVHKNLKSATTIDDVAAEMLSQQEAWPSTFAINTTSVISVSATFLPLLHAANVRRGYPSARAQTFKRESVPAGFDAADARTAQIITTSSISGYNREITAGLAYTASKAGATLLGKSMANFLAGWGIRSNVVAPGRFPSEMTAGQKLEFPVGEIPLGQPGRFEDMAGTILYLVGKAGAYVNGNVQVLDGGRLSVMPATY